MGLLFKLFTLIGTLVIIGVSLVGLGVLYLWWRDRQWEDEIYRTGQYPEEASKPQPTPTVAAKTEPSPTEATKPTTAQASVPEATKQAAVAAEVDGNEPAEDTASSKGKSQAKQ